MRKKYRVVSKVRFTMTICLLLFFFLFCVNSVLGIDNAASSMSEPAYMEVQIQSGDTLWDLASAWGPAHCDIRKVVFEICQLNDVQADEIHPGQLLLIPISL